MADSIGDIKTILTKMDGRLDHMPTKADLAATGSPLSLQLAKIEERISHMPTKVQMYTAGGAAVAAVLGILAKPMKWL